jgi:hypothetical protein
MFCYITENWRGRPLINRETVINLIGNTRTVAGLTIRNGIDDKNLLKMPESYAQTYITVILNFHNTCKSQNTGIY